MKTKKPIFFHGLMPKGRRQNIILCDECGRLLAKLEDSCMPQIYMIIRCTCGNTGYLKMGKDFDKDVSKSPLYSPVVIENDIGKCRRCGVDLFITTDNVKGFSFISGCSCGGISEKSRTSICFLVDNKDKMRKIGLHNAVGELK